MSPADPTEVARAQRSSVHARTWVHVPADGADQMGFLDAGPLRTVQAAMERTYAEQGAVLGWRRGNPDAWVLTATPAQETPDAH